MSAAVAPAWRPASLGLGWAGVVAACVALCWLTSYRVHDADSQLYAAMSADLAARPLRLWCAPQWQGHWGRDGLFFEHPPGMLWAAAGLVRLGAPSLLAVYCCNFAAFLASMALLWRLGRHFGGRALGRLALLAWVSTPAFLQYLVRGDQEHPLCCAILLALTGLCTAESGMAIAAAWALGLALALMIKGIAGLALVPIGALYVWRHARRGGVAMAVGLGTVAALASAWMFDRWYAQATGTSFWQQYAARQVQHSVGGVGNLAGKIENLGYYLARPLWFGWPLVAMLLGGLALRRRLGGPTLRHRAWELGGLTAMVFIGGFSLADRKADRYIFPIYPLVALSAAWLVVQVRQALPRAWVRWAGHVDAWFPWACMAIVGVGVGLKIYVGTYHYVFIRWWPGA